MVILLAGRFIAFASPYTLRELITAFDAGDGRSPWPYLFAYVALRFLSSSSGLSALRAALWAPVMQYSDREMSELSFNHLLNLSYNWHIHRKTGEVLRILDRGAAINHIFELILFTVVPTFIDIVVALVFFAVMLDWALSLVVFFVLIAYSTSLHHTSRRTGY
jgi:ABC-type bacteriocin/lantibiotic exporter with double-glycine peptidase domain